MEVICDFEWDDFINNNVVSRDVIEIIAIRIMLNCEQTAKEIAIYKEHSVRVENMIKKLKRRNGN